MNSNQLKQLSTLPADELTGKLISLAQQILQRHDAGKGLSPFDYHDVEISPDGSLILTGVTETTLTDDIADRNLNDYAAIVYCVSTGQKSAESMGWDAGRKIKQPVLREIVLTICGRNDPAPLIKKLHEPYKDEDTFFDGYTTVDEKEASEAYAKSERIKIENANSEIPTSVVSAPSRKPWAERIGTFLLMALCYGGYKACQVEKDMKHRIAVEQNSAILEHHRIMRQTAREYASAMAEKFRQETAERAKERANADTVSQNL